MTHDDAARQRADYLRALREERDGYLRAGLAGRASGVDDEITRVEGRPVGRSESPVDASPRRRRA